MLSVLLWLSLRCLRWLAALLTRALLRALLPRRRRLNFLKALGPLTVCVISIALMNIFDWCASLPCSSTVSTPQLVLAPVPLVFPLLACT